jgi:hypothetical protein
VPFYIEKIMVEAVMKNEGGATGSNFSGLTIRILAFGGMAVGIMLMLIGLIISGISSLENKNHDHWVLILLVSSFVFLGFGAHGLDLIHDEKRKEKKRRLNISGNIQPSAELSQQGKAYDKSSRKFGK